MKRKTLFLLVGVVIIWGFAAYRLLLSFFPTTTPTMVSNVAFSTTVSTTTRLLEKKEVSQHQRDPFLGTVSRPVVKKRIKKPVAKPIVEWPSIAYMGRMQNLATGEIAYFVMFNGSLQTWEIKKTFSEVYFIKGYEDRITVRYKDEQRVIKLTS